jgi:transposase-like protein
LPRFREPIRFNERVEEGGEVRGVYSPVFKKEALRLVHSSEERYPVAQIARDLGVSAEMLHKKWVNQVEIDAGERELPISVF